LTVGVAAPLAVLLAVCLLAHGELYERRPPAQYLTNFYLTLAVGGLLGGAAISLAAPRLFSSLMEYPLILSVLGLIFWQLKPGQFLERLKQATPAIRWTRIFTDGFIIGSLVVFLIGQIQLEPACMFRHRNFYGIYRVIDEAPSKSTPGGLRKLLHGRTNHGAQFLDPARCNTPVAYYFREGPIGQVYEAASAPRRMAVLGLGAGVMTSYLRAGESLTFYEIDPDDEKIARKWFSYLDYPKGPVTVVLGDGRLSMSEMPPGVAYDLILVDAFSGDGIPTHLLTREAIEVYLDHLAQDGLICLHISNRYYDLRSVIKATAARLNLAGAVNLRPPNPRLTSLGGRRTIMDLSRDPERLQPLLAEGWTAFGKDDHLTDGTPWTDDYVNLLAPLWARFHSQIISHQPAETNDQ
jgi:hypothetical protein